MPKIRFSDLPKPVWEHLLARAAERTVSLGHPQRMQERMPLATSRAEGGVWRAGRLRGRAHSVSGVSRESRLGDHSPTSDFRPNGRRPYWRAAPSNGQTTAPEHAIRGNCETWLPDRRLMLEALPAAPRQLFEPKTAVSRSSQTQLRVCNRLERIGFSPKGLTAEQLEIQPSQELGYRQQAQLPCLGSSLDDRELGSVGLSSITSAADPC